MRSMALLMCLFAFAMASARGAADGNDAAIAAARDSLEQSLARSHGALRIELRPDVDATTSRELAAAASWRVRSVDTALRRHMTVVMEASEGAVKPVRISFVVDAKARAWRLVHAVDTSQLLGASDVEPIIEDAIASPNAASPDDISQWRATHAMSEGHVLLVNDLVDVRAVLRGDAVDVRLSMGAVSLETRGVALNAGKPGELVKVSLPGRRDIVEGVVGDARQILVKQ